MKYPDQVSYIPPWNLSDEVTNIRCEMKYPDNLSDIPPCADNFTLLLTSTGQEWQFHITTDIYRSRMAISHY